LAELEQVLPDFGHVQFVHVVLGADWQGTADDLQCLSTLSHRQFFRLDGAAIGDNEVMMFAEKDDLLYLQLIQTRVTPAAVDAIKLRQPKATVYIRNQALLGIEGGNHLPQGVFVKTVPPGTGAAAAGIMPGDVITHLGDEDVPDFDRLTAHIGQCQPGKEITVTLIRGGDRLTKQVTLGQWPDAP
jgi:membrane-associated protease RseP (regulator of RpoE activity)